MKLMVYFVFISPPTKKCLNSILHICVLIYLYQSFLEHTVFNFSLLLRMKQMVRMWSYYSPTWKVTQLHFAYYCTYMYNLGTPLAIWKVSDELVSGNKLDYDICHFANTERGLCARRDKFTQSLMSLLCLHS